MNTSRSLLEISLWHAYDTVMFPSRKQQRNHFPTSKMSCGPFVSQWDSFAHILHLCKRACAIVRKGSEGERAVS